MDDDPYLAPREVRRVQGYKPRCRAAPGIPAGLIERERRRVQFMVISDLYEKMKTAPVVLTRGRRRDCRGRYR